MDSECTNCTFLAVVRFAGNVANYATGIAGLAFNGLVIALSLVLASLKNTEYRGFVLNHAIISSGYALSIIIIHVHLEGSACHVGGVVFIVFGLAVMHAPIPLLFNR